MRAAKDGILTLGSITGKLSIVAPCLGTGFNVLLAPFTFIPGVQIVLNDGAKTATYTGNTPGSGETYQELLSDTGFDNNGEWSKNAGWSVANSNGIATAVASSTYIYQLISTTGKLIKVSLVCSEFTSGIFRTYVGGIGGTAVTQTGTFSNYLTSIGANSILGIVSQATSTSKFSSLSMLQVLTADTTGFNATACTAEAGFNGNALAFSAQIRITP